MSAEWIMIHGKKSFNVAPVVALANSGDPRGRDPSWLERISILASRNPKRIVKRKYDDSTVTTSRLTHRSPDG
ncbi:hypothetical protein TNCV_475541 [Trichonephila clavipes]|nr:hypothetical protein TNCV_475541 [Trichonephila clavipes]